jgi:hypothetical protein
VDSRLQNKLQNNIVKRPLVLPGAFCIVIKKQLRYNIYVVEMIRKIYEVAEKYAPEYDIESICRELAA